MIFFPDKITAAGDRSLTRIEKTDMYKAILKGSPSLKRIVCHLESAEKSIDLCLYLITCQSLGLAILERLKKRGVKVRVIVDADSANLNGSFVPKFMANGAFVRMKKSDYLMHHKFAIVDDNILITGSFNWTMQAAMGNHENLVVTSEPNLVRPYVNHFEELWQEFAPQSVSK